MNSLFLDYNIPDDHESRINCKPTYMVKITLNMHNMKESFWVWIESINNNEVTGIICNNLQTYMLEIGQKITFTKNKIKEISNRSYTKEDTEKSIEYHKFCNNPITKYFESINLRFS